MYYIYILRCSDNSLYTGITNNMQKRYGTHVSASPSAAKYTKSHTVVGIEAIWKTETKSDALRLECRIKKLPKPKKEELIGNPLRLPFEVGEGIYAYIGKDLPCE